MKFRKLLNALRDSLLNIFRHPLVSLASVTTVAVMLTLLGIFVALSLNINHAARIIASRPPVEIWCESGLTAEQEAAITGFLEAEMNEADVEGMVQSYTLSEPYDNYQQLIETSGDPDAYANLDYTKLPYVYEVQLRDPEQADAFGAQIRAFPGIIRIDFSASLMENLSSLVRGINAGTLVAFAIMVVVTLFIISNMVRISVFARSDEVEIERYVGATNSYIRIPYIIEGALIGAVGALISWLMVYLIYRGVYNRWVIGSETVEIMSANTELVLPVSAISTQVLLISLLIGIVVGAVGSALAVRKHIQV